ncbi:MAG: mechanosensitive ion channel [Candidatus Methanomethyliaceae archaeon]|nr:mechanosensitive ion channel [Candidatus Methanomethyliaceae archaeon]
MRSDSISEFAMAILALLSILLLLVDFTVPLEPGWRQLVYSADLIICLVFALDFALDLRSEKDRLGYFKWHWIDLLAMVPAYAFAMLETSTVIGAGLRSLRLVRLARFLAVMLRMRRSKMLVAGEKPSKRGLLTYASAAILVSAFYLIFLPDLESIPYSQYIIESILSLLILLVALALSELVYILLVSKIDDLHSRLSVGRLVKVVFIILAIAAIISFIFKELIIFVTSFGVIGLLISYSLAPLISNFFAWVYINIRKTYMIGDSVKIGDVRGIVTDIGYIMTTLIEIGDESSFWSVTGRVLTIPNSMVLSNIVAVYGSRLSPVRVGAVTFNLAYESDLGAVKEMLIKCVSEYIRPELEKMRQACESGNCAPMFKDVIEAGPRVIFTPEASWINVTVLYPYPPSKLVRSMSELTEIILREMNKNPDVVKFPVGRSR